MLRGLKGPRLPGLTGPNVALNPMWNAPQDESELVDRVIASERWNDSARCARSERRLRAAVAWPDRRNRMLTRCQMLQRIPPWASDASGRAARQARAGSACDRNDPCRRGFVLPLSAVAALSGGLGAHQISRKKSKIEEASPSPRNSLSSSNQ